MAGRQPSGCQQSASGTHGHRRGLDSADSGPLGGLAPKNGNRPNSTGIGRRDHNPRVGGSSPSSGIWIRLCRANSPPPSACRGFESLLRLLIRLCRANSPPPYTEIRRSGALIRLRFPVPEPNLVEALPQRLAFGGPNGGPSSGRIRLTAARLTPGRTGISPRSCNLAETDCAPRGARSLSRFSRPNSYAQM